jgi:DNA replication protein DnaC
VHPTGPDGEPQYRLAVPCRCLQERQRQHVQSPEYQRQQGARPSAQTFDNFRVPVKGGARDARDAAHTWTDPRATYIWLLIYGGVGNGKSHLCNAALKELLQRGVRAKLTTAAEILQALRVGMQDHTTDDVMRQYQETPALIVDDLGAGMKHPDEKGSEWEWGRIEELLVFRYENLLPTMATTNLIPGQLPERIRSRFEDTGMSRMVLNAGSDYRGLK